MKAIIAGCGITGPALGVALAKAGIEAHLVEARRTGQGREGAFLALAPNGQHALRTIGLGIDGIPLPEMRFVNAHGKEIGRLGDSGTQLLRRGVLHDHLRTAVEATGARVSFDARVVRAEERGDGVTVHLDNGEVVHGDVLLGADGVHSAVRALVAPSAPRPRYTGVLDCGAWTPVDLPDTGGQRMVWGHRAFFGYVIHHGTAYWFSNVAHEIDAAERVDQRAWLRHLRELHADDPDPVPRILAAADAALGVWPIFDLGRLTTWHTERMCLLGDAAHAASPSAGQGVSIAVEDAVELARCLRDFTGPAQAFAAFQSLRKKRAELVVAMGRRIGDRKVPSRGKALFRDLTLPFFLRMGAAQAERQYEYRIDWDARV